MRDSKTQIGGDYYSKRKIQPIDIIREYGLNFFEGNALKYLLRHRDKNGRQDIEKMIDYGQMILDDYDNPQDKIDGGDDYPDTTCNTTCGEVSRVLYYGHSYDVIRSGINDFYILKSHCSDDALKLITTEDLSVVKKVDEYASENNLTFMVAWEILINKFKHPFRIINGSECADSCPIVSHIRIGSQSCKECVYNISVNLCKNTVQCAKLSKHMLCLSDH